MVQQSEATPPLIKWAQQSDVVFLTICLEDCKDPEIKLEPEKVYFKGVGGTDKKPHEVTINLFKEIEPEKSKQAVRDRIIELTLKKKDVSHNYWAQLTKEKEKFHWLKVDFNRWKNEESSDDERADPNNMDVLTELVQKMGDQPRDQGAERPNLEDLESDSDDDDDDLMPYLS